MAFYSDTWITDETTLKAWSQSTFELDPTPLGFFQKHIRIWLGEICDPQLGGQLVAGTGYQDGVYPNVDLNRVAYTQTGGENMKGTVTVTGGGVSSVEITQKGNGFKTGDYITALNLAQVGGTGGGFQAEVTSADATIGIMKSFDFKPQDTYPVMMTVGFERKDGYQMGYEFRKTSNTTTTYQYGFYVHSESASNGGYGTFTYNHQPSGSFWYPSNGAGQQMAVWYNTTPGQRFFLYADNSTKHAFGYVEALRPENETFPPRGDFSPWMMIRADTGRAYAYPATNSSYNIPYSGFSYTTLKEPSDQGVLFSGEAIFGRAYLFGYMPRNIKVHDAGITSWLRTLIEGANVYTRVADTLYVKEGEI